MSSCFAEVTGAWWCSWSSKSAQGLDGPGWVRFPFTSAIFGPPAADDVLDIMTLKQGKIFEASHLLRFAFAFLLVPAALAAFVYGITAHSIFVSEPKGIYLQEPAVIFDTTIDGIVLTDSHTLKRTYSGQPPSLLCPT
jgi:hypothetical protein